MHLMKESKLHFPIRSSTNTDYVQEMTTLNEELNQTMNDETTGLRIDEETTRDRSQTQPLLMQGYWAAHNSEYHH